VAPATQQELLVVSCYEINMLLFDLFSDLLHFVLVAG
jgi:hypothetical protein